MDDTDDISATADTSTATTADANTATTYVTAWV